MKNKLSAYNSESSSGYCFRPYSDRGKPCASAKDCMGECRVISPNIEPELIYHGENYVATKDEKFSPKLENCREVGGGYSCAGLKGLAVEAVCTSLPKAMYSNCGGYWVFLDNNIIKYSNWICGA